MGRKIGTIRNRLRKQAKCLGAYLIAILFAVSSPLSMAQVGSDQDAGLAGRIIMVSGEVTARDSSGSSRQLRRRDQIFVGDTVFTGAAASTQIRMVDTALISLKESTEFTIVAYRYERNSATDVSTIALLQGGFRTITGVIGRQNKEAYEARIGDLATIGIRGTDYEVVITPVGEVITGVYDGGTTISNDAGSLDLGFGTDYDFAIVPDSDTPPFGLLTQPAELGSIPVATIAQGEDDSDDAGDSGNDGDGDATGDSDGSVADNNTDDDNSPSIPPDTDVNTGDASSNSSLELAPPSADVVAATPAVTTASTLVTTAQAATTSALSINPNETSGDGSISCATDASVCPEIEDGLLVDPPIDDGDSGIVTDDTSGGDTSDGNNAGGNSDNSNAGGNSDNSNAGGNSDNSNAGGSDNSANDNSNAGGSDNSANDNSNAGGNDNSNAGGNDNSDSGSDNSGSDTSGSDNSNAGGNDNSNSGGNDNNNSDKDNSDKRNSGNNGKSNDDRDDVNDLRLSLPGQSIDEFGIAWGRWNNNVDENWLIVAYIDDQLVRITTSNYLADVVPTNIANLSGSHSYATGIASTFIGSGSAGAITSLVAALDVNFDTGMINNGSLQVQVADQVWSINFDGSIRGGIVDLNAINGQLIDGSGILSNAIDANLGGVFTGGSAEAFVGGFDLLDTINSLNSVEGLFTIER